MKRLSRMMSALRLAAAVATSLAVVSVAFGQGGRPPGPPAAHGKAPIRGYTRTNRKTGQPELVKPHARHVPKPKPVEVQPYVRGGKPVGGHQRRPPAKPPQDHDHPAVRKAQAPVPLWARPGRWTV